MIFREYKKGEMDEIYRRFDKGGILWFIERTDTHQFYYENLFTPWRSNEPYIPDNGISWENEIHDLMLSSAFLTKEDGEKITLDFTEGGCRYCNSGSNKIPIAITEHEFVPDTD